MFGRIARGSRHVGRLSLGSEGFTIVELIIAVMIIAIGVFGLMAAYIHMARASMTAEETTVAANAGRAKMDEVAGMTFQDVIDLYLNQNVTFPVAGLLPTPAGSITATQVGASPTVLEISVTIAWTGVVDSRTVNYRTRLTSK